jgi:hypothetical protein
MHAACHRRTAEEIGWVLMTLFVFKRASTIIRFCVLEENHKQWKFAWMRDVIANKVSANWSPNRK